jgi:hypothetical protein
VPTVEGAWARIDGTVHFLIAFPTYSLMLTRYPAASQDRRAPVYAVRECGRSAPFDAAWDDEIRTKAAIAAIRFERTHEPSRNNLYNGWVDHGWRSRTS